MSIGCNDIPWQKTTQENVTDEVVAYVDDAVLTNRELQRLIPPTPDSSLYRMWRRHAIDQWIDRQLVYHEARQHLPTITQDSLEAIVEAFRRELWAYTYARLRAIQQIDTHISESAIQQYYQSSQALFRVSDTLLHLRYVVFASKKVSARIRRKVPYWLAQYKNASAGDSLLKYCAFLHGDCRLDGQWISPHHFVQRFVGVPSNTWDRLMRRIGTVTRITTPSYTYWFYPTDRKYPGDIAPLATVKPHIQHIIRQQRLHQAVDMAFQTIAREARTSSKHSIKLFVNGQ